MESASLRAVFTADTGDFDRGAEKVKSAFGDLKRESKNSFSAIAGDMRALSGDILKIALPMDALFGVAIKDAVKFDNTMTNIGAVLGLSREEIDALGASMLTVSQNSKFSGQVIGEAFYDIVGGVADASTHMAILEASVATAEAGQADLTATTNALVSVMNAYSFGARKATRVSDVLTLTVNEGVGTMDELAGSFAQTAGLASAVGVDVEELGLAFSFISQKGFSFSEAGTQVEAVIKSLLNPTKELEGAFSDMGMTQDEVLQMLSSGGIVKVLTEMTEAGVDLTKVFSDKEALMGVLNLSQLDGTALREFKLGLDGVTQASRDVQATGAQYSWDTLTGDLTDLSIIVGQSLLPAFQGITDDLSPMVQAFGTWAKENPETIQTIAGLALGATALGFALMPLSWIVGGLGAVWKTVTVLFGIALPIVSGLWGVFVPFGIAVSNAVWSLGALALSGLQAVWMLGVNSVSGLWGAMTGAWGAVVQLATGAGTAVVNMATLAGAFMLAHLPITLVVTAIGGLLAILGMGEGGLAGGLNRAWTAFTQLIQLGVYALLGALTELANTPFIQAIRTAFESAFNFIIGLAQGVINKINEIATTIGNAVNDVQGFLTFIGGGDVNPNAGARLAQMQAQDQANTAQFGAPIQIPVGQLGQMDDWGNAVTTPADMVINASNWVNSLTGKADGGDVFRGQSYVVGEEGMEIFSPSQNGSIIPNDQIGGGVAIYGDIYIEGIEDRQALYDELQGIGKQRSYSS